MVDNRQIAMSLPALDIHFDVVVSWNRYCDDVNDHFKGFRGGYRLTERGGGGSA